MASEVRPRPELKNFAMMGIFSTATNPRKTMIIDNVRSMRLVQAVIDVQSV
jgi:hypothetical protein